MFAEYLEELFLEICLVIPIIGFVAIFILVILFVIEIISGCKD